MSNKIANYSFLLFLALLAMIRLTDTANESIINLLDSWLFIFSLFAKIEGYLTQRSLAKTDANLETLEKQLNSITEKVNLKWSLDKGSYLKSSPCILNISHCNDVEYESDKLEKNIFLKIMRNILLKYDFRILCFNSYRGIIVTRERTLNNLELKNINKDLEDALTREAKQEKNILCILDHLKKISNRFSSKFCFWDYYPEENYFALNIFQLNKANEWQRQPYRSLT